MPLPERSELIISAVKEFMEHHGVPERQQSKKLAEIFDQSYSQAHRKLNGGVRWTVAQLQFLAEYFGGTIGDLNLGQEDNHAGGGERDALPATLVLGAKTIELPCLVWVGDPLKALTQVDLVALREDDRWQVVESAQCPERVVRYRVCKLEIVVKQPPAPTVAILDDESGFADNLCEFLNENGFMAQAFYTAASLEKAIEAGRFDGYVIDWILGNRTAEGLIRKIRFTMAQDVPIYLLTGEVVTGLVHESEAARVIKEFDVLWRDKPIRLPLFAAELHKAISA